MPLHFRKSKHKAIVFAAMLASAALAGCQGGEEAEELPPRPVKAADTTGAGDCFSAALTVRLALGDGLEAAMEYAANASAYSVQHKYVMPSLPNKEELDSFFTPLAITKRRIKND